MEVYLKAAYFIDSDHPVVRDYSHSVLKPLGKINEVDKAVALYYAVRDDFRYDPYRIDLDHHQMKASTIIGRDPRYGYCVEKACVLAAVCRAAGIPSRVGFANVRNHIGTEKLEAHLQTDVLVFHGYTELYLNGKWVKATPAFNLALCNYLKVKPLDFNGKEDSIFQEYDREHGQFMEYLADHGTYHDIPHDRFVMELKINYPHLFAGTTSSIVDIQQ